MLLSVFVKGHITFTIDGQEFEFIHRNISAFGITGLPWGTLNAREHFGREITASIRIPGTQPLALITRGYIMREYTAHGAHMGLKFKMDDESRAKLSAQIQKNGTYPTDYLRKYPRIPAEQSIQTFPLRVLVLSEADAAAGSAPIVMDVGNLSPNGILLYTENQSALDIQPGARLNLALEPRGWFPMQIQVQGLVCRVVDELSPQSGNLTRYLGIKFSKVDDVNRTAFMDLLKDILTRLKPRAPSSAP